MMQVILFIALAFSIVIAIFAIQNTTPVGVAFVTFHAEAVAVSLLVLISAALGAGVMLLLGIAREVRHGLRHRSLSQQLSASQSRVRELEAQAATTPAGTAQRTRSPGETTSSEWPASPTGPSPAR